MKKILITGGAGFIGSALAVKLIEKKYEVVILDNLSKQVHGENPYNSYTYNLIKDKAVFIRGDVNNTADWIKALSGVTSVIHLAAETGTGQSMYEINKYIETNIGGTSKLLDLLSNKNFSIEKLIIASSRSVYGEGKYNCEIHGVVYPTARKEEDLLRGDFHVKCPLCSQNVKLLFTDEESKLHPTSIYGFTKLAQEQMCLMFGKSTNLPVVAFRFQNVYGEGQSLKNPYTGILSIFSTRIKNGNQIDIFEDGLESRDFVHVNDVVDAIILGLESSNGNGQVFNVGSGILTSVLTVSELLKNNYNSNVSVQITSKYRVGDIRHNVADLSKIKALLGYEPKIDFKTGLSGFVKWVESQNIENDNYEKTINEMKNRGLFK